MSSPPLEAASFAVDAPGHRDAHRDRAALRPKDAATIILVDRRGTSPRFLMGRRGGGHAFMPDLYVFPGGRRDRRDHALPFGRDLHPLVTERLLSGSPRRMTAGGARALALAAMRELKEETGLSVNARDDADLGLLRYVARAITPPGNVRRFDTRFFLLPMDDTGIATDDLRDSDEMQDLRWVGAAEMTGLSIPRITLAVLDDVNSLLAADPSLPYGTPVPFYFMRRGRFVRTRI